MIAILLSLVITVPFESDCLHDHFDLIELNHLHNDHMVPSYDQLLFWDWDRLKGRFICQGSHVLHGSRDKSDEDHRRQYDIDIEAYSKRIGVNRYSQWNIDQFPYPGKFNYDNPKMPVKTNLGWKVEGEIGYHYRTITSKFFRETWTQVDPESRDRKLNPLHSRRGLTPSNRSWYDNLDQR